MAGIIEKHPRVRTDTEVAQAVRRSLERDVLVPDTQITSTVSNGLVTLAGTVDHCSQREDSERAVRHLNGVCGVVNRITVKQPRVAASHVRKAVDEALERWAEREAQRIDVQVKDGTVILSGRVSSWEEKLAVAEAARCTPGVTALDDCLRFES
jgi:osmotically-inducible protein OsmY